MPPSVPFLVQSIQISGNALIDTPTLLALVASAQGQMLTLPELAELASRITTYYRNHDLPLARAIIPAQTLSQGVVRIEVIETRYGQIRLDNTSQVRDSLLQATLSQLQKGQAISQAQMDHVLLLLSDVPGVLVDATLSPGDEVGASDLLVSTTPVESITGGLMLDGYGNRYTGRPRLGLALTVDNLLHRGDTLALNAVSSGRGMNYGRLGYEVLLNGRGTRAGAAYSTLRYVLGEPITTDIHGTAQVSSLWAKHPLVRSRDVNVNGQIQFDGLKLRDYYSSVIQNDRNLSVLTASLAGDTRDQWLNGGINSWNVSVSAGHVGFDNAAAQLSDAASANTQGRFAKWSANFVRLQSLTASGTLYVTASRQWANTNLDSSQKMSVGGPYTVRGYDIGALSGDSGYFLSAEYRHNIGRIWSGQWQAVAFVDRAQVSTNAKRWSGFSGENSGVLNGTGLGLNWSGPNQWSAKAYLAKPIGSAPASVAGISSTRAWLELARKI